MKIKAIIAMIAVGALLISRGFLFAYDDITYKDLEEIISKGDATVLDVREADEVASCKIPDSIHIPLAEISHRANELDPEKEIVVYCAAGVRSVRASKILNDAGFKKVKNLKGGIRGWSTYSGAVVGPCK